MPNPTTDPHLGMVLAGYYIEERIARGGMSLVYRAKHINLRRRAAIKIIAPELAEKPNFRERFNREARIAGALLHPNIVTVYDAGEQDGLLYIAMQYIDGCDLADVLNDHGRLRGYRALDICTQVAEALDAAHAQGLIHRDIKPANVLIQGATAFLTDFGLTKQSEGTPVELTKVGDMVGTIDYIAPEQIEGSKVDPRTDIYSLGCLFYQCLTGAVPFARDTAVATIYAHMSEQPPPVSSARPELPATLDAVIAQALEKDPARRFPSCVDMMAAARDAIDAAGPQAESAFSPPVPVWGDHAGVPTFTGARPVPAQGDPLATATTVGAFENVGRAPFVPERPRVLLAGLDMSARALARVAAADCFEFEEAQIGDSLLDTIRDRRPALVVLGWDAPGRPAREVIAALRADDDTRESKVLLLVDYRQASRDDVAAAGADDRLRAPFSPLQLRVKLRRLLADEARADAATAAAAG